MDEITFDIDITANHLIRLPDALPVGARARVRVQILPASGEDPDPQAPGSEIARLALAARQAHLASGGDLMGPDEISREVRRRRGGVADD